MNTDPLENDKETLRELLRHYDNLRAGRDATFLEEDAFEKIIDYFDDLEDFPKALEAAELSIEYFPFSASLLLRKADVLLSTRKYYEALDVLEKVELLDATDINLYILKTDAYLALDRQDRAVEILEQAIDQFEGEEKIELLFELADVYDDYEEFEKVFDCLQLILQEDPTSEEALYKICFWADFTGRYEESIRLHLSIIDEHPYSELAWFNLAAAYQGLKLYEKAIDAYQYALVIDEKFDFAYRNIGDAYIRLRKYKEAIEALEKVLELAKPEDVIYEAIGHCYDRLKNYAQARFHYRKAVHLNAEDARLHYKIACTYFNEQQWAPAAKQLETALRLNRQQTEYNLLMGECQLQLGAFKEAIHYFSTVVGNKPRNKSGWEALIRTLYQAEFYEEAQVQAHAALQHTEGKPLFLYYLAAVQIALGRTKEGLLTLEGAVQAAPRLLNKFVALCPELLQNQPVVEVIARNKRARKKSGDKDREA
ncbi:tetratricopeptide repeat protein [Flaviaesturariibacter amylovorans]|uniref:Tetratricopeptide repeat protein n=1 Tax=Flaviaesturariibacter amylovorans TaxID=1084520 RepID=A0ABP8GM70_9BACT